MSGCYSYSLANRLHGTSLDEDLVVAFIIKLRLRIPVATGSLHNEGTVIRVYEEEAHPFAL